MKALGIVRGGPNQSISATEKTADKYAGQYEGAVGPPSYEAATTRGGGGRERRKSLVGRWIERRKGRREEREERVPDYAP